MSAPKRLIIHLGQLKISAFMLEEPIERQTTKITCKECSPIASRVFRIADVVLYDRDGEHDHRVFHCTRCERDWCAMLAEPEIGTVAE